MSTSVKEHGDFKNYFDTTLKRNYWLLGYFGGGSINVKDAYEAASEFANAIGVPIETVKIDEVLSSRWCKGFKYLYSTAMNQTPEDGSDHLKNVFAHFSH